MAEGLELVGEARRSVADLVEGLSAEQRQQTTLCGDWTPHHVLAHLTMFTDVALPKFFFNMAKAGFDYDKMADAYARQAASEHSVEDLAAALRAKATKGPPMPMFPPELNLADVAVHTQDVRRGLGLEGALDETVLRTSLDFMASHKQAKNLFDTDKLDGTRLQATDIDWNHGEGEEVSGPAEALMMALCSRDVYGELSGAVDRLR